ncbi:hypothetical protein [Archangium primigenium]|uniref:hypothetical protein n=1 Tax=[Archangium] primigenium TaxID=2792470 RepID=UPI0019596627|nr:hypothetical protein [Archangium primigenium]MBM7112853.1 hypothetical protein [Archangium primigenium]
METEEQEGGRAEGLPLSFYARWDASTVDEKLALAREAASHPGFDAEDAFEVGGRLEEALEEAGRHAELEAVLDEWRRRAPRVHDAEPAVYTWRVELALRRPGGDVKGALVALARRTGDCALVTRLAEWCLYRGRVEEAWAGLREAWPRVREDESLPEWTRVDYVTRAVLTGMDAALFREPALGEPVLASLLAPFERAVPHWLGEALALRTGREAWRRRSGHEVLALPVERFIDAQRALVMSFEPELRLRQGWPWGRTQLLFPELFHLLPGPYGEGGRDPRPEHVLLPVLRDLEQWVWGQAEERALHPHVHAALTLSLRPWGEYLCGLGLLGAEAWADWWAAAWEVLAVLPEQFATAGDGPLVDEVHRFFRGGAHGHG